MYFERVKDPKEALNIGIFAKRSFKDDFEAGKFILDHLETIVNKDRDFSKSIGQKVEEYIIRYVSVEGSFTYFAKQDMADPSLVWMLRSSLTKIKKSWDSKFIQDEF